MPYLMTVSIPSILSLASYPKSSICARASRHPFSSLASLMDFSSAFSALRLLLEYLTSCHEEHAPQAVRIAVQIEEQWLPPVRDDDRNDIIHSFIQAAKPGTGRKLELLVNEERVTKRVNQEPIRSSSRTGGSHCSSATCCRGCGSAWPSHRSGQNAGLCPGAHCTRQ